MTSKLINTHTQNQNIPNCIVYGNKMAKQSKFITTGKQWILSRQLVRNPCQNLKIGFGDFKRSTLVFMETVQLASEKKLPRRIYKTIARGQECGSE